MAVLIEEIIDKSEESSSKVTLDTLMERIRVPPEYTRYGAIEDSAVLDKLAKWKPQSLSSIHALHDAVRNRETPTIEESAQIFCAVAPFLSEREWSSEDASSAARGQSALSTRALAPPDIRYQTLYPASTLMSHS
jgi:hypothetical protein